MLAKYFQLFEAICYQFFLQRKYTFTTKTRLSNELSHHNGQESYDGDSFESQSRFDACAIGRNHSMVIPLLANQDLTPVLLNAM